MYYVLLDIFRHLQNRIDSLESSDTFAPFVQRLQNRIDSLEKARRVIINHSLLQNRIDSLEIVAAPVAAV